MFYFVFYHNHIKSLFKASASRNRNKGMAEIWPKGYLFDVISPQTPVARWWGLKNGTAAPQ